MQMAASDKDILLLPDKLRDQFYFEDILGYQEKIIQQITGCDFSKISFIEPYSMISFLMMGRNYLRVRGEKLRIVNIPLNIHQYLVRMDFPNTGVFEIDEKLNEKYFLKRSSQSRRLIEITEIPNKERESVKVISHVIEVFRKRASNILKFWISDNIIDFFVTVISELCQNIFEHSLDSGYLTIQTYSMDRENIVRLVISDSGRGIVNSFEKINWLNFDSNAKFIEMALTTPISSKREFGYGLCQVNSIVEKLKGTIFIRSGDASLTALYHKKKKGPPYIFHKNNLVNFNGTQISITLYS
jgi:anti-sigma regulatory factor (Ser/Thr protein kinase)